LGRQRSREKGLLWDSTGIRGERCDRWKDERGDDRGVTTAREGDGRMEGEGKEERERYPSRTRFFDTRAFFATVIIDPSAQTPRDDLYLTTAYA